MKRRNSRKDIDKDKMFSKLMPTFPVKNDDDYSDEHKHNENSFSRSSPKRPYADLAQKNRVDHERHADIRDNEPDFMQPDRVQEKPHTQTPAVSPTPAPVPDPAPAAPSPVQEDPFLNLQSANLYQQLQNAANHGYIDPQTQAFLNAARNAAQAQQQNQGPQITAFRPEVISTVQAAPEAQKPAPAPAPAPEPVKETAPVKDDSVQLINIIEYVVENKLESSMNAFKCCSCQKCRQAATIKILNNILPEYTYMRPSEVKASIDESKYKSLNQPIIRSILDIKANPPH